MHNHKPYIEELSHRIQQEDRRLERETKTVAKIFSILTALAIGVVIYGWMNRFSLSDSEARERAVMHLELGDTLRESGNLSAAKESYQKALDIERRLAIANRNDVDDLHDWAAALGRLATIAKEEGNLDRAKGLYEKIRDIMEGFAVRNPNNARVERSLWHVYGEIAGIAEQQGSPEAEDAWQYVLRQGIKLKAIEQFLPEDERLYRESRSKTGL